MKREGAENLDSPQLLRELLTCQHRTLGQTRLVAVLLALLVFGLCLALALTLPRVSALAEKTEAALSETEKAAREVEQLFSGAETLQPEDLEALAAALRKLGEVDPDSLNRALRSLSELDVSGFRESMERLQSVDVDSLNAAIARLGEVDLDSLNEAITNLNDAVRPLAELARRLGG